ncbi:MAG: hypothetical protein AAF433_00155 [Bacteroidota bacterium]
MSNVKTLIAKIEWLQNPLVRAVIIHCSVFIAATLTFGLCLKQFGGISATWFFLGYVAFFLLIGIIHSWLLNQWYTFKFSVETTFNCVLVVLGYLLVFLGLITSDHALPTITWMSASAIGFIYPFYIGKAQQAQYVPERAVLSCPISELESAREKDYFIASDHYIKWKIIHGQPGISHVDTLPVNAVGVSIQPAVLTQEPLIDLFRAFLLYHNRKLILSHNLKSEIDTEYTWSTVDQQPTTDSITGQDSCAEHEHSLRSLTSTEEALKAGVHCYHWCFYADKPLWFGKKNLDPHRSITGNRLKLKWHKERSLIGNEMTIKQITVYAIRQPSSQHLKQLRNEFI